jgi:hypothetical protein
LVLRVLQRRFAEAHVDLKQIPELVSTVFGVDQIPRNTLLRFGRAISRRSSGAALIPQRKWHCEPKMHLNSTHVVRSFGTTFLTLTLFLHPGAPWASLSRTLIPFVKKRFELGIS